MPMKRLRRFMRDEDGLVLTEFLILLPLLLWAFMALYIYWDTFRVINQAQKASYAVSDLISRQGDVNMAFVNGMDDVMALVMRRGGDVRVRITSVEWDEDDDEFLILFSRSPGSHLPRLNENQIDDYRPWIPVMANHDSVIIVETEVDHAPIFDVGITPQTFRNLIVTRPRFNRRICLAESMATCPATV